MPLPISWLTRPHVLRKRRARHSSALPLVICGNNQISRDYLATIGDSRKAVPNLDHRCLNQIETECCTHKWDNDCKWKLL